MGKPRMKFTHTRTGEPCVYINSICYSRLFLEVERQHAEANSQFEYVSYLTEIIHCLPELRVLN